MESLTWKIVAQSPFGGLAPKYYRNVNHTYGQANQFNDMNDVDLSDLTCIKQAPSLTAFTIVNSLSTPVNTYETFVHILDKKIGTLGYAISASYIWSINITTHTITAIHQLPASSSGKSLAYYDGNLYYIYNTASASDIGKYDLVSSWTDTWGSTQPTTPSNVFRQNEGAVATDSLVKMILGNKNDIGLFDGTSLSMQAIESDSNNTIASIVSTETITYVGYNTVYGGLIAVYSNTFDYTDDSGNIIPLSPDATIMLKGDTLGGMFYKNGLLYITYKKGGYDAFTLGYLNGSQITDLFDVYGTLPTWKQITYFNDQVTFINNGEIYQYGRGDSTLNFLMNIYCTLNGASCISNVDSNLLIANATNLYYQSGLSTSATATSLSFICSDRKHLGYVDNIQVRTNTLGTGAGCTLQLIKNKGIESADTKNFTIETDGKTRHVTSDVKMSGCEELKYKILWSNGSSANNCEIREIIINGHLEERGGNNI